MKKRMVSLLVLLMIVGLAGAMPVAAAEITASDGHIFTTDTDGYIQIWNAEDLTEFTSYINNGPGLNTSNARLKNNIVLRPTTGWDNWGTILPTNTTSWIPIGTDESHLYNGTFDGAGYTVSGIYINLTENKPQGLFGVSAGTIKNLGVIESWINGNSSGADQSNINSGGVVGRNYGSVSNCYNTGTVSNGTAVGGVVGQHASGTISNCYNTGTISGSGDVGGVVGSIVMGAINNCYNTGPVSGGGFVGGVVGSSEGAINNCYNTGTVSGSSYVGGVVGEAMIGVMFVKNCYYADFPVGNEKTGIGGRADALGSTVKKDTDAFTFGEVAWLLQKGQASQTPQVWGQKLADPTKDLLPVLKNSDPVYKITMNYDYDATLNKVLYRSASGEIHLPAPVDGTIYTYTQANGTIISQAQMEEYVIGSDETFTVKKYQLTAVAGVFRIGTPAALTDFSRYVNDGNTTANVVLTEDIVFNEEQNKVPATNWEHWGDSPPPLEQWLPIGTVAKAYNGTFDGAGHTVSGIYINATSNPQGLFGTVESQAKIKNLGVIESWINVANDYNCYIGGIVGTSKGSVSNCYNAGKVNGGRIAGGVVGYNYGTISNCYNTGTVRGNFFSVAGMSSGWPVTITNCYYLNDSNPGSSDAAKSSAAFASGEVAWLLQNGQTAPAAQVWGQNLVGTPPDTRPLLKITDKIYCVTFQAGNGIDSESKAYTNKDGKVTPPKLATGYVWKDIDTQAVFTADIAVTEDLSVQYRRSLAAAEVSIIIAADSYTATGTAITPTVTVTDAGITIATDDYSVAYTNNINPGTATVTITGQGNYAGIVTKNFTITSSGGGGGGGYTPPAPPAMPGVVVNPGTITFDPAGHLAVDITGAPAGSAVYYSLDGITFTTTPPAMENAGEHTVYVKITSPGYQDYITQTTVTVEKHEAPVIPEVSVPVPLGQQTGSTDLGALLPPNRGQIRYQLVSVNDPREILSGTPTIDPNGRINYGFARPLSASGENLTASAATDSATSSATITVLVTMENYADTTIILVVSAAEAFGVQYQTHIQDIGWETDWKTDGALSGTEGQSKRLEALKVELTGDVPAGATIDTAVHVQNVGNLGPFAMGTAAGTTGESLRLENICLTLKNLPGYTILYDVHVQNQGWLRDENDASTWFKSGEVAGTSALSLRLEGIRIKLVKTE